MSATKEYHHDLIEKHTRQYDVFELEKLTAADLHDLGESLGIDPEIKSKQLKIRAILEKQAEKSTTPAMPGDDMNSTVSPPCKGGECVGW
jgi:hypothetical protein